MSIVIVTKNQYLVAQKIHHIVLNERKEYVDVRNSKGKYIGTVDNYYDIYIIYTPESTSTSQNSHRGDERSECTVTIRGKVDAYRVYRDLIHQIREQCPDDLFLNKALENLLSEADFKTMAKQEGKYEDQEKAYVTSPTKVRRTRKAKRPSKAVLRKSKRRN